MIQAKKFLVGSALFLGGFRASIAGPAPHTAPQMSPPCSGVVFPAPINELLKEKFAGWRPKQISDMDQDDQQLWLGAKPKECPGFAVGHYEKSNELSYAILLVPRSDPSGGYKVVVFDKKSSGEFHWSVVDHANGQTCSCLVISKVPPGRYSDFEGTRSVQVKLDSILVEWMEKGAVLFHRSEGRYERIRVSD
jgi:hypothetical protein